MCPHQRGMAPAAGDPPVLQHDYLVELIESIAVVGDEQRRAVGGRGEEVRRQRAASLGMQVRGGLVEYQQRRIGEQGAGQRQRLALARALLADPALLILDEPATHLDPGARRALTADLLAATDGRATLFITHDRDGLDQLDEIVVLDSGRVTERGSHAALMRAHGPYRRMWQTDH